MPVAEDGEKKVGDANNPPTLLILGQATQIEEQLNFYSGSGGRGSPNLEAAEALKVFEGSGSNSRSGSGSGVIHGSPGNGNKNSKNDNNTPSLMLQWLGDSSGSQASKELGLETRQRKVLVNSGAMAMGRELNLSALSSFQEQYAGMSGMCGVDNPELTSHVLESSAAGERKHVRDEPSR
jgi:hypothetical protein